jgi:hypothetical protein
MAISDTKRRKTWGFVLYAVGFAIVFSSASLVRAPRPDLLHDLLWFAVYAVGLIMVALGASTVCKLQARQGLPEAE